LLAHATGSFKYLTRAATDSRRTKDVGGAA
jgi:hypothetical protein